MKVEDIGRTVRETQYAVRGPIVARAQALERAGRTIIYCNIGNPQALGQRPLTWVRQVLALCEYPELLDRVPAETFPADVVAIARQVLDGSRHGLGAYTDSRGYAFVREAVAEFIRRRDAIAADPESIYLTDGASKAAQSVLRLLIDDARDGIMVPIPQYPLYSATITLYGGALVPYALDERSGWELSRETLERAYAGARERGVRPRAIVVINPGNPTGAVLHETNIGMVLGFAAQHGLTVLADEVYQENLYVPGDRFVSFAQVLEDRGLLDVSLFSFHSVSKGFLGECGHRGGYVELRNVPEDVRAELTKLQSVSLCANSVGQIVTYLMVRPPKPGDPSFAVYDRERREILIRLAPEGPRARRGAQRRPRHPLQSDHGGDVRLPEHHPTAGRDRRSVLHGSSRGDGHLPRARLRFRTGGRDVALPHDDPAAPGADRDGRREDWRLPRGLRRAAGRRTPRARPDAPPPAPSPRRRVTSGVSASAPDEA
jgi:aspartate/methionine/tyrosine aminotransferase